MSSQSEFKDWTVDKIRLVLKKLLSNRRHAWKASGFLVQSKLTAWKQLKVNLDAAAQWGLRGHFFLVYNNLERLEQIKPGDNSHFQGIRERINRLIRDTKEYIESSKPK